MRVGRGVVVFGCVVFGWSGWGGGGCRGRRMWEMELLLWEVEWIGSKEGGVVFGGCVLWAASGFLSLAGRGAPTPLPGRDWNTRTLPAAYDLFSM